MSPRNLKYNFLDKSSQVTTFDKNGRVESSCNTLFDLGIVPGDSLFDAVTFVGSIQDQLDFEDKSVEILTFLGVESSFPGLDGIFDFYFYPHPENPDITVWIVIDQTTHYTYLRKIQLERNQLLMKLERLQGKE